MELLEFARNVVREKGYIAATALAIILVAHNHLGGDRIKLVMDTMEQLESKEIHRVEYANEATKIFRRKDLFYYNPEEG